MANDAFTPARRAALTLALIAEARDVVAAFAGAGIRSAALKGLSVHARGLYPGPDARPMNDADLLVDPARIGDASGILRDLGYRPHDRGLDAPARLRAYLRRAGDLNWIHRGRPWAMIDLHWDLARCDRFRGVIRMPATDFLRRSTPAPFPYGVEDNNGPAETAPESTRGRLGRVGQGEPATGTAFSGPSPHPDTLPVPLSPCPLVSPVPLSPCPTRPLVPLSSPTLFLLDPGDEIPYLAAHYSIFCHRRSGQTLEDIRRLLSGAGILNSQFSILNSHRSARRWGVGRALRTALDDLRRDGRAANCVNFHEWEWEGPALKAREEIDPQTTGAGAPPESGSAGILPASQHGLRTGWRASLRPAEAAEASAAQAGRPPYRTGLSASPRRPAISPQTFSRWLHNSLAKICEISGSPFVGLAADFARQAAMLDTWPDRVRAGVGALRWGCARAGRW